MGWVEIFTDWLSVLHVTEFLLITHISIVELFKLIIPLKHMAGYLSMSHMQQGEMQVIMPPNQLFMKKKMKFCHVDHGASEYRSPWERAAPVFGGQKI